MALTVSELAFVFGADAKAVDRTLAGMDAKAQATASRMDRSMGGFWREETTRARRSADEYGKAGREAGSRFVTGVKGQLAGLAIGAGAVLFLTESITAASSLGETLNKNRVIFGDAADDIEAFAKDSTKNILLTEQQALDAAATFGIFGKSANLTGDDLSSFSTRLTALASDFSSFFDSSPEEAITAIGAALRGESEPIRAYGVLLDDATLRQRALKMGLIETTKDALTPQQRVLAAYREILAQTTDAQGDAARTQDSYANSVRILQKDVAALQVELGEKLLPVAQGFVNFMLDDGIPMLEQAGGAIVDLYGYWADLPDPIKATAAAIVALRVADALGWTDSVRGGVSRLGDAITDLRLRTMLAGDEFRNSRANVMGWSNGFMTVDRSLSRTQSTLNATKVALQGVGTVGKSALGGLMGILGGPWGIALGAAAAGVTYFWQEHQQAKAHVEELTASLDKQTGALTENSREAVFNALQKSGAVDLAKQLGISLEDLTSAALGETTAVNRVNAELDAMKQAMVDNVREHGAGSSTFAATSGMIDQLRGSILGENDAVREAIQGAKDHAEAMGDTVDGNEDGADSFKSLRDRMREAREEVDRLADAEQERREANLADRQDRLALIQQMQATREEATNKDDVKDARQRITDARTDGARERRGLRERLADVDSGIADARAAVGSAKTGDARVAAQKRLNEAYADAARQRRDINESIADSLKQEHEAVAAAEEELAGYTQTLNEHTKAGQENLQALYDLANQWNGSSEKVRNAKGAYDEIRESFIDTAIQMGASSKRAEKLATDLLLLPEPKKLDYPSDDLQTAIDKLKELRALVKDSQDLAIRVNLHQDGNRMLDGVDGRAVGGPVFAGRPYKVGETGVEIFRPKQDGYILPSSAARAIETAPAVMSQQQGLSPRDQQALEETRTMMREILARRTAPLIHADTITHTDMRETTRYARAQGSLEADGGVPIMAGVS